MVFSLWLPRFKGSHTGQRIADLFDEVCVKRGILNKLDYIVTENASNMKKAFNVCFPRTDSDEDGKYAYQP